MTTPDKRRLVLVLSRYRAVPPPGVDADAFAAACLADTYEVAADLSGVVTGLSGPDGSSDLLWPGSPDFPDLEPEGLLELLDSGSMGAADRFEAVVLVPADVPDLPGLVLAKVFQALDRAQVAIAPERAGPGCVALGVRLPLPVWWPRHQGLSLDHDPYAELGAATPRRNLVVHTPGWHRLRTSASVAALDPGLEGWEQTRALLSGRPLSAGGPSIGEHS